MSKAMTIVLWIGGAALLAATAIDTFAVIGRHIGLLIPGSIEMMQAAVLVSGAIALLVATVESAHARVKLVVGRLSLRGQMLADRLSDLLTLFFFLALLAGAGWIAWDLRDAHEQSELLGIPWMALRLIAAIVLLATCGVLAWRVIFGTRQPDTHGSAAHTAVDGE